MQVLPFNCKGSGAASCLADSDAHGVCIDAENRKPLCSTVSKELWGVRGSAETVTSRDSLPGVLSLSNKCLLVKGESCVSWVLCVGPDILPGTGNTHLTRE